MPEFQPLLPEEGFWRQIWSALLMFALTYFFFTLKSYFLSIMTWPCLFYCSTCVFHCLEHKYGCLLSLAFRRRRRKISYQISLWWWYSSLSPAAIKRSHLTHTRAPPNKIKAKYCGGRHLRKSYYLKEYPGKNPKIINCSIHLSLDILSGRVRFPSEEKEKFVNIQIAFFSIGTTRVSVLSFFRPCGHMRRLSVWVNHGL